MRSGGRNEGVDAERGRDGKAARKQAAGSRPACLAPVGAVIFPTTRNRDYCLRTRAAMTTVSPLSNPGTTAMATSLSYSIETAV